MGGAATITIEAQDLAHQMGTEVIGLDQVPSVPDGISWYRYPEDGGSGAGQYLLDHGDSRWRVFPDGTIGRYILYGSGDPPRWLRMYDAGEEG